MRLEIETDFQTIRGGEICHFKLLNYRYLTIMWRERTQFSNSTFWRLVVQNSSPTRLRFVGVEFWTTHVRTPVSKMFRWRTYNSCPGCYEIAWADYVWHRYLSIMGQNMFHPCKLVSIKASSKHSRAERGHMSVRFCHKIGFYFNKSKTVYIYLYVFHEIYPCFQSDNKWRSLVGNMFFLA